MPMLQLQSKQDTQVRVHLCNAKDADEQCPITMSAINDDDEAEGPHSRGRALEPRSPEVHGV